MAHSISTCIASDIPGSDWCLCFACVLFTFLGVKMARKDFQKCEWLAEVSLGSALFFLLLYCRTVLDLLYFFFFPLRRGLGWHLLQYCDDYMKIVNCTEFTYRICSFKFCFRIKYLFFFLWLEGPVVQLPTFCPPAAFFSELWLRVILQL